MYTYKLIGYVDTVVWVAVTLQRLVLSLPLLIVGYWASLLSAASYTRAAMRFKT